MGPTIFIDIDHVISDARWRDPMIGVNDWDEYHEAAANDNPVMEMIMVACALVRCGDFDLIGLTARPAKWEQLTLEWFLKHRVPMNRLLMRPDDDYQSAPKCKIKLALEYFGSEEVMRRNLMMVIDDNMEVITAFANLGVSTAYFQIGSAQRGR